MAQHHLVSGFPSSFPPLPLSSAPPCTPCVEGRQCATLHSSLLTPATTPLQELYFLVVVDNFSYYTMVFPLEQKANVHDALIQWLVTFRAECPKRPQRVFP
ncbi:unnamed protein product [Closterium sp. NIES-54]